jgi:hypothetical protein
VREAVKENGGEAAVKEKEMVTVLGKALRQ